MEQNNFFSQSVAALSHGTMYSINPNLGIDQFRFWLATNRNNPKLILKFFDIQNDNKFIKSSSSLGLPSINQRQKIYCPMLVRDFDMKESNQYNNLTDEKFLELTKNRKEKIMHEINPDYHTDEEEHDSDTQVKIRVLNSKPFSRTSPVKYEYAIIHFHGGGFICQDSSAH